MRIGMFLKFAHVLNHFVVEDVNLGRLLSAFLGRTLPDLGAIKVELIGPFQEKTWIKDYFDPCWPFKQVNGEPSAVKVALQLFECLMIRLWILLLFML